MFGLSEKAATALSIPATYATAFGFMFGYGKLLVSLASSGLLSKHLVRRTKCSGAPYAALTFGSLVSFLICFPFSYLSFDLCLAMCLLTAFAAYFSQFIGYYNIRTQFSRHDREFRSPLGSIGAAYGSAVFLLGAVSLIAFQDDNQLVLVAFVIMVVCASAYYFLVAKYHQRFSQEELQVLYSYHVIKRKCK